MKDLLLAFSVLLTLSSCSAVKNSFGTKSAANTAVVQPKKTQFIEGIEVKPVEEVTGEIKPRSAPVTTNSEVHRKEFIVQSKATLTNITPLEQFSAVQFKYAIKLDVPVEVLQNKTLYETISDWWGTPYRMGGTTRKGVDCSAFVQTIMLGVFAVQLPRTAREQKTVASRVSINNLQEGDLIFFNTKGGVSHVGVYLHNNKFIHASTSKGVMISDLNDIYWGKKIIGGGRVLHRVNPKP